MHRFGFESTMQAISLYEAQIAALETMIDHLREDHDFVP